MNTKDTYIRQLNKYDGISLSPSLEESLGAQSELFSELVRELMIEVTDVYSKEGFLQHLTTREDKWYTQWKQYGYLCLYLDTDDSEDSDAIMNEGCVAYFPDNDGEAELKFFHTEDEPPTEKDTEELYDYDQCCWYPLIAVNLSKLNLSVLIHELIHLAQHHQLLQASNFDSEGNLIEYFKRPHELEAFAMTPMILKHIKENRKDLIKLARKCRVSTAKSSRDCGFSALYGLADHLNDEPKVQSGKYFYKPKTWAMYESLRSQITKGDLSGVHAMITERKKTHE